MTKKKRLMLSADDFRAYLVEQCKKAGGQKNFAKEKEVPQSYLSQIITGRQDPGPTFCEKVGFTRRLFFEENE